MPTKIVTVIGARPQFVKAAVVSRAIAETAGLDECVVHTGQHYDKKMSDIFFEELGVPKPAYNLAIGSGTHGEQTGQMLAKMEQVLFTEKPNVVLVYGDTNSTLAGALAAVKLHIPVAHVEAGLRSFNRRMPEEINRIVTDNVSSLLFCPTPESVDNLRTEGITSGVELVGDVMYDCAMSFAAEAEARVNPLEAYGLQPRGYILMTCHRAENTDDPARLTAIMRAVNQIAEHTTVLFPVHPRATKLLQNIDVPPHPQLKMVEPVSYLEMLLLERGAAVILTDSGGIQKEAFFYGVPCVTMRDETEWVETVNNGANTLTGANEHAIVTAVNKELSRTDALPEAGQFYGAGQASVRIAQQLAAAGPELRV